MSANNNSKLSWAQLSDRYRNAQKVTEKDTHLFPELQKELRFLEEQFRDARNAQENAPLRFQIDAALSDIAQRLNYVDKVLHAQAQQHRGAAAAGGNMMVDEGEHSGNSGGAAARAQPSASSGGSVFSMFQQPHASAQQSRSGSGGAVAPNNQAARPAGFVPANSSATQHAPAAAAVAGGGFSTQYQQYDPRVGAQKHQQPSNHNPAVAKLNINVSMDEGGGESMRDDDKIKGGGAGPPGGAAMAMSDEKGAGGAAANPKEAEQPGARYHVERTIRDTLYGKIKIATDIQTQHLVALKLSRKDKVDQKVMKEDPKEELRIYRLLQAQQPANGHPYIVKLLNDYVEGQWYVSVLEFCGKGEFFEIVVQAQRIRNEPAQRCFKQMALAVEFMHARGIAHMDLSLENVLVDNSDDCKVCDFGLARQVPQGQNRNFPAVDNRNKAGKMGYMSPEYFAGKPYDGMAYDIFSMGVMLFIMLTGTPPFEMSHVSDRRFQMIYGGQMKDLLSRWNMLGFVNDQAIDLMSNMLCPPERRYTIQQVLAHPYMRNVALRTNHLPNEYQQMAASSSSSNHRERQLVGSLLEDGENNDAVYAQAAPAGQQQAINRASTAPPHLHDQQPQQGLDGAVMPEHGAVMVNGEVIEPTDPRYTPEYYAYYMMQRPMDPRLPPPLFNWNWQQRPGEKDKHGNPLGDPMSAAAAAMMNASFFAPPAGAEAGQANEENSSELADGAEAGAAAHDGEEQATSNAAGAAGAGAAGSFAGGAAGEGDDLPNKMQNMALSEGAASANTGNASTGSEAKASNRGRGNRYAPAADMSGMPFNPQMFPPFGGNPMMAMMAGYGGMNMAGLNMMPPFGQPQKGEEGFAAGGAGAGAGRPFGAGFGPAGGAGGKIGAGGRGAPGLTLQQQQQLYMQLAAMQQMGMGVPGFPMFNMNAMGGMGGEAYGNAYGMHQGGQYGRYGGGNWGEGRDGFRGKGMFGGRGNRGGRDRDRDRSRYGEQRHDRRREPRNDSAQMGSIPSAAASSSEEKRESAPGALGSGGLGGLGGLNGNGAAGAAAAGAASADGAPAQPAGALPSGPTPRAAWLDDFRLNKANSNLTLKDVCQRGLIIDLATDQYGSRFIQQRVESASPEEKQMAFEQLMPETLRLCTDVFGNYVIQKFLEQPEHRKIIASKLVGSVLLLSLQMYGCRVIQKAIDMSDPDTQAVLVRELQGHVMQCVKDQNGNHVIQKCIERVPPHLIQFIVESFHNQIFHLSTHPYGCRVIQRLLEHCTEQQRNQILSEILENTGDLCKNQYGNYVIQHVLIHGTQWHKAAVIQQLKGKILLLSKHKFASNVVEKAFAHASRQDRNALLEEVLGKENDNSNNSPLVSMVKDQYANYVVQKMIDVMDDEQRNLIVQRIKRHVPNLRKIPYGKHIIARIEKLTGKPILP